MAEHRFVRYGVLGLVAALVSGLIWVGYVRYQAERRAVQAPAAPEVKAAPAVVDSLPAPSPVPALAQPQPILVHVAGAVAKPGVYTLTEGARVADAIAAAGGPLPEGVPDALNLADRLADGQKVTVQTKKELEAAPPVVAAAQPTSKPAAVTKANVNTATAAQLDSLPGVTPTVAKNIVEYRTKNGPFKKLEDLDKVSGIGPATIEKLRPYLTL